jgi:hypothetical protein
MILHVWPLVGLVLIARTMKNRHRGKGAVDSEIHPADAATLVSASHREGRCD